MKKFKLLYCLILVTSCVSSFDPDIDEANEHPLIIDASLTNEEKRHEVIVNQAKNIDNNFPYESVEDAIVFVEDGNGQIFNYDHISKGRYRSQTEFAGIVGETYKLVVEVNENLYESDAQELLPAGEIKDINARKIIDSFQSETGTITTRVKVAFSVDLEFSELETSYYRFEWEATYQNLMPNQGSSVCWDERDQEAPLNLESGKRCYITETDEAFLELFDSKGLQGSTITDVELFSITPSRRFQFQYSPEIKLYSISKSSYDFWDAVNNQIKNSGSLFDSPPSPIIGNIKGMNPEAERVIGIFEVATVTARREFFLPSVIAEELDNFQADCLLPSGPFGTPPPPRSFYCCECTLYPNSTDVKPEFWQD